MSDEGARLALAAERIDLMARMVQDLRAQLAEALSERDAARAALGEALRLASVPEHAQDSEWYGDFDRLMEPTKPTTTALTRAITAALRADPRPFVEVYADVVQDGPWARLWRSLSVGERAGIVEQAKREAGR